jgi:hypothetical protein
VLNEVQILESGEKLIYQGGQMHSVEPPESFFGFTYWALMIPPECPENPLILGGCKGRPCTIQALIEKIWNPPQFTDIDILNGHDAFEFVQQTEDTFDYIIVDLWNGDKIEERIFDDEFVTNLAKIATLRISVNVHEEHLSRLLEAYEKHFKLELGKSIGNNRVVFFKVKEEK